MSEVTTAPKSGTLLVTDLDQFIGMLTHWHERQLATVQHLYEVPEGVEVQEEDGQPFKLEGDVLRAFKLGLQMATEYLGVLPFTPEYEDQKPSVH